MDAKAIAAQILIASSWDQRAGDRPPPKPWWWADTRAIAELKVTRLKKTLYVMQDDSGESLAFGPGHMHASAKPAQDGHVMIAGHRDSHFEFLKDINIGDIIETTNYHAQSKRYKVTELHVMDSRQSELELSDDNRLSLITCYPFDDFVPGGPLRFIVNAQEI